ncbi:MAG: hypothetical protein ABII13_02640 [Patescibacteria group bacterium]|nr:hypothetical protein [Patescibacteria group bacterium]MBU2509444.1 hypothetical protein [Patescibacteria group bacterium]
MFLFIDTHKTGLIRLGFVRAKKNQVKTYNKRSDALLGLLESKLGFSNIKRCKGICVVCGPGSFSSVRGGVVVANLLSRLLKKSLFCVYVDDAKDLRLLAERIENEEIAPVQFASPVYLSEPNITRAREHESTRV